MNGQLASELGNYWHSVVETMAEGLFVVNTQGQVVFMNPAAERITGYQVQEALGRPCSFLESPSCQPCQRQGQGVSCPLFDGVAMENLRCALRHKDGRLVHVLKNARLLRDASGRVLGGVETLTDISELVAKDLQIDDLRRELERSYGFEGLVGDSRPMQGLYQLLQSAAQSEAPVVLLGESGTGKELAASAIHRRSVRHQGPFIKVNCAALNESLLESELFGHEKGAFTGAIRERQGRFEAADTGTLFLDEIGDLPPSVQVKLLRVLQEGEIERVGSHRPRKVDVRIISATNQDLARLLAKGAFREDLYYRINVIPIDLPPLRERLEDLPLLADHFARAIALRSRRKQAGISAAALQRLAAYTWPGNVRELINALEYAFVTCRSGQIQPQHLPPTVLGAAPGPAPSPGPAGQDEQRREILAALKASGGRKAKAAELLGVSRVTLWKRLKRLGLQV